MEKRTRQQHIRGLLEDLQITLRKTPVPENPVAMQLEGTPRDYEELYQRFKVRNPHSWKMLRTAVRRIQRQKISHLEIKTISLVQWDRYLFSILCHNTANEVDAYQRGKFLRGLLEECGIAWDSSEALVPS